MVWYYLSAVSVWSRIFAKISFQYQTHLLFCLILVHGDCLRRQATPVTPEHDFRSCFFRLRCRFDKSTRGTDWNPNCLNQSNQIIQKKIMNSECFVQKMIILIQQPFVIWYFYLLNYLGRFTNWSLISFHWLKLLYVESQPYTVLLALVCKVITNK